MHKHTKDAKQAVAAQLGRGHPAVDFMAAMMAAGRSDYEQMAVDAIKAAATIELALSEHAAATEESV